MKITYRAYIKSIGWIVPVLYIDFEHQLIGVDLSDGKSDRAEYSFHEVYLMRGFGLLDKNRKEVFEKQVIKFTRTIFTDCGKNEIERIEEPVVGEFYFSEGLWPGIRFADGTGSIFFPGQLDSEIEFEIIGEMFTDKHLLSKSCYDKGSE